MIQRTDVLMALERGMRAGFLIGERQYQTVRDGFVDETTSDGAFEQYGDMGATPWPTQNGGGPAGTGTDPRTGAQQVGSLHEGGPITVLGGNERSMIVHNQNWEIPIGIYHSAIDDQRVGNLEQWARNAGARFQQHMDAVCFAALNAGEGSTYGYGYDGQPFFSATHVDPGGQYQTAQDNQFTLALNPDNFNTVYIAGASFLDDRGQPAGVFQNLLIHSVSLMRDAAQITDNPNISGTGNRDTNPYNGQIMRLHAPGGWLDSTAWFLVNNIAGQRPIGLQIRQRPMLVTWDDHSGPGIRYYKWTARYNVFYRDWRNAVQGNS